MTRDPRFALSQELEAKQPLLDQLRALAAEDHDLFTDLLEGETNLLELIVALDVSIVDDETLADGAKTALDKLQGRKRAAETRIELKRRLLAHTLQQIGGGSRSRQTRSRRAHQGGPRARESVGSTPRPSTRCPSASSPTASSPSSAFLRARREDHQALISWRERNRHALRECGSRRPGRARAASSRGAPSVTAPPPPAGKWPQSDQLGPGPT